MLALSSYHNIVASSQVQREELIEVLFFLRWNHRDFPELKLLLLSGVWMITDLIEPDPS